MCLLKYFYFVFTDFIVVVKFVCGSHDIHNFIDAFAFFMGDEFDDSGIDVAASGAHNQA